jgi:GntR family transcriptional regulator
MIDAPAARASPSFQPLYLQIKQLITGSLDAGEWAPGEAIPSEVELARRFGVSQGTVRKAIAALAAENLVVRRQGKGTFVATHTEERASIFRFLRLRPDDGRDEIPAGHVLEVRRQKAGAEAARLLQLRPGDGVVLVRRVLEYAAEPVVLDEITLPAAMFRGLSRARIEEHPGSMYGLFETRFGVRMIRAEERIKAVAADPDGSSAWPTPTASARSSGGGGGTRRGATTMRIRSRNGVRDTGRGAQGLHAERDTAISLQCSTRKL